MTNGLTHPYHLDESSFILRGIRSKVSFFDENHVSKKKAILFDMSHQEDARLI